MPPEAQAKIEKKTNIFVNKTIYLTFSLLLACVSRMYSFTTRKICFHSLFFLKTATMFKLLVILLIITPKSFVKYFTQISLNTKTHLAKKNEIYSKGKIWLVQCTTCLNSESNILSFCFTLYSLNSLRILSILVKFRHP